MPLGPPKKQTPLDEERGGPSKFDSRNHDAWTPQRNRHPSTRRGGAALKIRFSKSCRLDPPKKQIPLHEEREGGSPQNSIFEIMPLGPFKGADTLHEQREGGKPSKFISTKHASPGRQATAKHDRDSPRRTGAAPSTTEAAPNTRGERQTRHRPIQT